MDPHAGEEDRAEWRCRRRDGLTPHETTDIIHSDEGHPAASVTATALAHEPGLANPRTRFRCLGHAADALCRLLGLDRHSASGLIGHLDRQLGETAAVVEG